MPPPPVPPTTPPSTPPGSATPGGSTGEPTRNPGIVNPWPLDIPDGAPDRRGQRPSDTGPFALPILHPETIEPNELLLAWRSAADATRGENELATRYGMRPSERLALPALGWTIARYRLASNEQVAHVRQRLMREHPAWLVDFNTRYLPSGAPQHYAHGQIGLAGTARTAGRDVRVGVLDGPVARVPALAGNLAASQQLLAAGENPAAPTHGTAVAALIAGWDEANGFAGVAPGARVHAAGVLRSRRGVEDTTTRNLLAGLDWLAGQRVQVLNMSIGGPPNRLLAAAVFQLQKRSITLVAAAGNGGPAAQPFYPAAYAGVIAVTATDARNEIYAHANRGSYVALSAPGVDVWTPGPEGGFYASGTSFASAIVSGAIARMLAGRRASSEPIATRLCRSALDLGERGQDPVFGCGLLRMDAMMKRK